MEIISKFFSEINIRHNGHGLPKVISHITFSLRITSSGGVLILLRLLEYQIRHYASNDFLC